MSLFRNTSSVLVVSIISIPLSLFTSIILARYLTLEDRSYYGVAITITGMLVILGNVGWPSAAIFHLKRIGIPPAEVTGATIWAGSFFSILVVAICLLNQDYIRNEFLTGAPAEIFFIALALFPLQLMGNYFCGIARGIDHFNIHNGYKLWVAVGRALFIAAALVILSGDAVTALWATLLTYAIGLLIALWRTLKLTGTYLPPKPDVFFPTLKFGLKGWVHALAGNIHERADIIMLSSAYLFGDHKQIALYLQAVATLHFIKVVPNAIGSALLPHLAGTEIHMAANETSRVLRHGNFWIFLSVVFLALVAQWVIPFAFGSDYEGAVLPFMILLPGIAFQTTYVILTKFWVAIDRQRVNIILQGVAMPLNIILNLLLIPDYGIHGAAFASLITYTAEGIAMAIIFKRHTNISFSEMYLINTSDLRIYKTKLTRLLQNKPNKT